MLHIFHCVFLNCETQYNFVLKNTQMTQKHNLHWCLCCSLYYKMHKTFFPTEKRSPRVHYMFIQGANGV